MKRIMALSAVLFLSLFFALVCSADSVSVMAGSSAKVTKNLNGTWTGNMYITGTCGGGFPEVRILNVGKGFSTHTGASEFAGELCMNLADGIGMGTAVITTANGDALYLNIALHSFGLGGPDGTYEEAEAITGGTGRFAGATGEGRSYGSWIAASDTSFSWDGATEGTIRY